MLRFGRFFAQDSKASTQLGLSSTNDFDAFPLVMGGAYKRGCYFSVEMARKYHKDATSTSLVLLPDQSISVLSVRRSSVVLTKSHPINLM